MDKILTMGSNNSNQIKKQILVLKNLKKFLVKVFGKKKINNSLNLKKLAQKMNKKQFKDQKKINSV